jgi:hypothetical protein
VWVIRKRLEKDLNLDETAPGTTIVQAFWIAVKERVDGTDRATDYCVVRYGVGAGVVETVSGQGERVVETDQRLDTTALATEVTGGLSAVGTLLLKCGQFAHGWNRTGITLKKRV